MTKNGNTWWSGRFLRALERLGLSSKLQKGREYLGRGHVLSLVVSTGGVEARVQGSTEYRSRIEFEPFTNLEWEESFERLAFSDLSAAALLVTGRLPPHIEDFFLPSGRRLLPQQNGELEFSCTCPDRVGLCKHLAATAYLFAERLDRDPWLLFLVRGRSVDSVKTALLERWNRDLPAHRDAPADSLDSALSQARSQALPLEDVDLFWEGTRREDPGLQEPLGKHLPTAKRLATPEPKVDEKAWSELLMELYAEMARRAEEKLADE